MMRQVMNGFGGQTHCITAKFITTRRQAQILDLIFIIFFFFQAMKLAVYFGSWSDINWNPE